MSEVYSDQNKASLTILILESISFIAVALSAITSMSLVLWVDLIESFCLLFKAAFVKYISKKLQKDLSYTYNYGTEKVESLASLFCDLTLLISVACIICVAIYEIVNPSRPSDNLFFAIFIKLANILADCIIVYKQRKVYKKHKSSIVKTEYESYIVELLYDCSIAFTVVVTYLLREYKFSWYLGSIFSILISIYVIYKSKGRITNALNDLSDKTLDENEQFTIINVLNRHNDEYKNFIKVNSHKTGETIKIDLYVTFTDDETYKEILSFAETIDREISEKLGDSEVSVIIRSLV